MLFGKSLPISFVAAHHPGHRGSHSCQGGVISALGVNDRGVTHASDTGTETDYNLRRAAGSTFGVHHEKKQRERTGLQ